VVASILAEASKEFGSFFGIFVAVASVRKGLVHRVLRISIERQF